jgi:hypothetical protein
MTTTIRDQVLDALAVQLLPLAGIQVEGQRGAEVMTFPTILIEDGGHDTPDETVAYGSTLYPMNVNLYGYVEAPSGPDARIAINALYGRVLPVLLSDRSLGGIAQDLREGQMETEFFTAETGFRGVFSLALQIDFFTKTGDPSLPG